MHNDTHWFVGLGGGKRDKSGGLLGTKSGKNVRFYLLKAVFEPVKNCELTPK